METAYHPQFGETINYTVTQLPDDPDEQVRATCAIMAGYSVADSTTPQIKEAIRQARLAYGPDPIWNSYWFTKNLIVFQQDEDTATGLAGLWVARADIAEAIVRPQDIWTMYTRGATPREDCDGFSMFLSAMLKGQGVDCSYAVIAADSRDPSLYSHVYVAAYPAYGGRVPLDASHGPYPDWEFGRPYRKEEFTVGSAVNSESIAVGLMLAGLTLSHFMHKIHKRGLQ
jgi:hypothetical protein